MADNTTLNAGAGGDTYASDDIGGVKHTRVKLEWGADGVANEVDDASGKRVPVKVAEALPAGTANIGDVDVLTLPPLVAGTANIGDVDIVSMPTVTVAEPVSVDDNGASLTVDAVDLDIRNLVPAQDSVAAVGADAHDAPVAANPIVEAGRASDAVPTAVSADGDVVRAWRDRRGAAKAALVDDAGDSVMDGGNNAVRVNIVAGAGSGGTAQADESSFVEGTTQLTPVGGVLNDTITSDPTEDQAAAVRITPKRAFHVNLRDASGNEVSPGGGTQYDEDTASAAAEKITMAGVVRKDTAASLVDTDGDRTELQVNATGLLRVDAAGVAVPVTDNAGSLTVDATDLDIRNLASGQDSIEVFQATGSNLRTQAAGIAAHDAPSSGNPVLLGGHASAAAPTDVSADGDVSRIWTTLKGAVNIADAGGSLTVDATDLDIRNLSSGQDSVEVRGAAADGAAVAGNPVLVAGQDGTNVQSLKTDAAGELQVDVLTLPALVAGAANIGDVDVLTVPAPLSSSGGGTEAAALRVTIANDSTGLVSVDDNGASLTTDAAGDTAHDAADAGNPIKIGAKAANALPTAVANNDRANAIADLFGRLLVGHIDPAMQVHINKTYTTQQTGTDVWDPTAGKKIAVTSLIIGAYGTTAGRVILWFGDNADTTFTQDTDQVLFAGSFAPSATSKPGAVVCFATPVFCTTADREIHITTDAGISLDVTIEGYEWA